MQQITNPGSPTRSLNNEQYRIEKKCDTSAVLKNAVSPIGSSKSSVGSAEAKFRRAKAELEKKHRLEMQEIERQQQSMDRKLELVRIKQEVESKRAELQRKHELLKLQNEIQLAELDEKLSCDDHATRDRELDEKQLGNDPLNIRNVSPFQPTRVNPSVPLRDLTHYGESTTQIWNPEQVPQRRF